MKFKQSSLFLALVLITAGPAFADHIASDSKAGAGGFDQQGSLQNASFTRTSDVRVFEEGKVVLVGNDAVQIHNFAENTTNSSTDMPLAVATESANHKEGISEFGSIHESTLGNHIYRDWADWVTPSPVPVPEPGSQLLFLVGLTGLGVSMYLRHLLRIAI